MAALSAEELPWAHVVLNDATTTVQVDEALPTPHFSEREVRVSRKLAYLLRHHQAKPSRLRGADWPQCFEGGWFPLRGLAESTFMRFLRFHHMSGAPDEAGDDEAPGAGGGGRSGAAAAPPGPDAEPTAVEEYTRVTTALVSEILAVCAKSHRGESTNRRYETREHAGEIYIRARYHISFDVHDPDLPALPGVEPSLIEVPTLGDLSLQALAAHAHLFEGLGNIGDPAILHSLWTLLLRQKRINNKIIRSFAVEGTQSLDLRDVSPMVTDSTLRHVAKGCPRLEFLGLSGCTAITAQTLTLLGKRCPKLQILDLSRVAVQPAWLHPLAKLKELSQLDLTYCRHINQAGQLSPLAHTDRHVHLEVQWDDAEGHQMRSEFAPITEATALQGAEAKLQRRSAAPTAGSWLGGKADS